MQLVSFEYDIKAPVHSDENRFLIDSKLTATIAVNYEAELKLKKKKQQQKFTFAHDIPYRIGFILCEKPLEGVIGLQRVECFLNGIVLADVRRVNAKVIGEFEENLSNRRELGGLKTGKQKGIQR